MEIKIIPADETKIRELEKCSAFTRVGLSGRVIDRKRYKHNFFCLIL